MPKPKIPHICVTCEHHDGEHFHCKAKDTYVSYAYAFEQRNCEHYELCHYYKKGGKFYDWKDGEQDDKRADD